MLDLLHPQRIAAAFLLVIGGIIFWQASMLDRWSFFGPGPGIFPQAIATVCVVLSVLLFLFPALAADRVATTQEAEPPLGPAEKRTFFAYCVTMGVLILSTAFLGFFLTRIVIALLMVWLGERRSLGAALVFGVICGLFGLIGFDYFMQVQLPLGFVDKEILRLFDDAMKAIG